MQPMPTQGRSGYSRPGHCGRGGSAGVGGSGRWRLGGGVAAGGRRSAAPRGLRPAGARRAQVRQQRHEGLLLPGADLVGPAAPAGVQPRGLVIALGGEGDPERFAILARADHDGEVVGQFEAAFAQRLAGDLGLGADIEEGEEFEGAARPRPARSHRSAARRRGRRCAACRPGSPLRASTSGGWPVRGDGDAADALAREVRDVAVEPQLRVGIDRDAAFGEPGLVLAGAADIGAFRHVALGADAAPADDQLRDHAALRIQHAQQGGGRTRPRRVLDAEPVQQFGIGGARFGQAQFGQADQQFAHLLLAHGVVALGGQHPGLAAAGDLQRAVMARRLDPRGGLQALRQAREGQRGAGGRRRGRRVPGLSSSAPPTATTAAPESSSRVRRFIARRLLRPAPRRGGGGAPRRGRWRTASAAAARRRC